MYILTISGHEEDGAYAVLDDSGEQTVYFFEEEDDCIRYAGLLEAEDYPPMTALKVDGNLAIKTCELHSYNYIIITSNDFVIPPRDDNIPKNQIS